MRVGFLECRPFHAAILRPVFDRLVEKHRCFYTADAAQLCDFQPHVVVLSEAIVDQLRPQLPKASFVHTRHGLASKNVGYKGARDADYLCVTSEFVRDWYVQAGAIPRKGFWTIGYVQMDSLFVADSACATRPAQSGEHKSILYAPTYNLAMTSAAMLGNRIVELLRGDRHDVSIVIKPHPHIAKHSPQWMDMWRALTRSEPAVHLVEDTSCDVMPYLEAADLLVTDASSVQLEFLALNRPMVLISNPNRFGYEHYDPNGLEWKWRDMGEEISHAQDLPAAVARAFADSPKMVERREHYRNLLFGNLLDGHAADRLAANIDALHQAIADNRYRITSSKPAMRAKHLMRRARRFASQRLGFTQQAA